MPKGSGLPQPIKVRGVRALEFPVIEQARGSLTYGEYDRHLPFLPKRYFLVFNVPAGEVRGAHAHRSVHQILLCVKGSCAVGLDDGLSRDEVRLDRPDLGLHIPPMVWATQFDYSSDGVLLVLCSDVYNPDEYISDYEEYLKAMRRA
jgi:UDP-2-acetamido-3-amino-2,3-dideoxy-glucuronate N-acetyltransferase